MLLNTHNKIFHLNFLVVSTNAVKMVGRRCAATVAYHADEQWLSGSEYWRQEDQFLFAAFIGWLLSCTMIISSLREDLSPCCMFVESLVNGALTHGLGLCKLL